MKKLLLVLLVIALAAFLLVGCDTVTPPVEGEGEGEAGICPTVAVTSQVVVGDKTYIKAGSQTITVTFAVPTEPVSVYVATTLKVVPAAAEEVVMYANAAKTVYTGTVLFAGICDEGYIYVDTCDACAYCKYPYKVDGVGPASQIKISKSKCVCEGCTIEFDSTLNNPICGVTSPCCGDACSGFASYTIDLYTSKPFDTCCDVPCVTPAYSCPAGVACPIDCTLSCITGTATDTPKVYYAVATILDTDTPKVYYAVATILDNVGNKTRYYATLTLDSGCGLKVQEYTANVQSGLCSDYTVKGDHTLQTVETADPAEIGVCKDYN